MEKNSRDFIGQRAKLYIEALNEFQLSRLEEVQINLGYLNLQKGEKILEIGAGSGLYSNPIADLLGSMGELVATDPSEEQLENIRLFQRPNIQIVSTSAEFLHTQPALVSRCEYFDAIWSLGAFHHCCNKSQAFKNFSQLLKRGGRMLICDVLSGSSLADYFDRDVARFSLSGHEVSFLTKGFFASLCYLFGFSEPTFQDIDYHWNFKSEKDLGFFMYKLHGMTKTTPEVCFERAGHFMQIERKKDVYTLHVPLTLFTTFKI